MTSADALFWNGALAAPVALRVVDALRDRVRGRSPELRREVAYRANVEFLESLGLDGHEVLGPPPRTHTDAPIDAMIPS